MQTYLHQCHKMAKTPQNMAMIQPWVDLSDIYNYYTDICNWSATIQKPDARAVKYGYDLTMG